jgi:protein O-mannosyl-transferase
VSGIVERVRRDPGLALAILAVVVAAALYAPTLDRGLVSLDDTWLIQGNHIVQQPSLETVHAIFFDTSRDTRAVLGAEYLPVRDLSVMLDFALWGQSYSGFHATNLALYLLALALWFGALAGFGIDRRIAGVATLIFAVHPAHAESVAWLSERKGLLALVFAGLAAFAYTRFRTGRAAAWLALAALAAVLAVWSKSLGAFAIAMIAALELALPEGRTSRRRAWVGIGTLVVAAGLAFIPVVTIALQLSVVAQDAPTPDGHGWVATVVGLHGFYARLAAMTLPNAISYPIDTHGPTTIDIVLGATWLAVIVVVAIAPRLGAWRPSPVVRAAALLWLLGWFPASRIVLPVRMVFVADRYLLLPTLGLALALAAAVFALPRRSGVALAAALVVAAGLRTLSAQATWATRASLWANAVASNPRNGEAWAMYAEAVPSPADAERVIAEGMRHTASSRLRMQGALLLLRRGEHAAGVAEMRAAADAGHPVAMSNLALLLLEDGAVEPALEWARRGAALAPVHAASQRTHGKLALAAGQLDEARGAFERAYRLEPTNLDNRYNLGLALAAVGRHDDARRELEACLASPKLAGLAREQLARLPR